MKSFLHNNSYNHSNYQSTNLKCFFLLLLIIKSPFRVIMPFCLWPCMVWFESHKHWLWVWFTGQKSHGFKHIPPTLAGSRSGLMTNQVSADPHPAVGALLTSPTSVVQQELAMKIDGTDSETQGNFASLLFRCFHLQRITNFLFINFRSYHHRPQQHWTQLSTCVNGWV